jgi:hypothetical protein
MDLKTGLLHTVTIKFKEIALPSERAEVSNRLERLGREFGGKTEGLLYWNVGLNTDQRKGYDVVEIAVFSNQAILDKFRIHPKHKELTDLMSRVCDWVVGDLIVELPILIDN